MSDEFVTRHEHVEFSQRMDAENKRLSHRIDSLEETVKKIEGLTISVERMAINISQLTDEMKKQGERLADIEQKPVKRYETVLTGILGAVAGAIGAAIAAGLIH